MYTLQYTIVYNTELTVVVDGHCGDNSIINKLIQDYA